MSEEKLNTYYVYMAGSEVPSKVIGHKIRILDQCSYIIIQKECEPSETVAVVPLSGTIIKIEP